MKATEEDAGMGMEEDLRRNRAVYAALFAGKGGEEAAVPSRGESRFPAERPVPPEAEFPAEPFPPAGMAEEERAPSPGKPSPGAVTLGRWNRESAAPARGISPMESAGRASEKKAPAGTAALPEGAGGASAPGRGESVSLWREGWPEAAGLPSARRSPAEAGAEPHAWTAAALPGDRPGAAGALWMRAAADLPFRAPSSPEEGGFAPGRETRRETLDEEAVLEALVRRLEREERLLPQEMGGA